MRSARLLSALLTVLPTLGCDELDEFEETFVDVIVVPGNTGVQGPYNGSFEGQLSALDLSQSRGFREAAVNPSDVDSIRVTSGTIDIDLGSPRLNDLSVYLESFEIYVASDNQPRTQLTRLDSFPAAAQVALPLSQSPELKRFATDTGMRFDADLQLRQQPALNVRLTTTLVIKVDIDLLGI